MSNVVDINAERERRKLERQFNPSPARDIAEVLAAGVVLMLALSWGAWLLGPSDFKAWMSEQTQEWK